MIGAHPSRLLDFLFRLKSLSPFAITALVFAFVNVAVVVDFRDELAASLMMPRLTGLDEIVVANAESAPDVLKLSGHVVAVFFRRSTQLRSPFGALDRVFIVAHQEKDFIPVHAPIACV